MQCCWQDSSFAANCDRYQNLIFSESTYRLTQCPGHQADQTQVPPFKSLVKAYHKGGLLHSLTENKVTIHQHLDPSSPFLIIFRWQLPCLFLVGPCTFLFFVTNLRSFEHLCKDESLKVLKRERGKEDKHFTLCLKMFLADSCLLFNLFHKI